MKKKIGKLIVAAAMTASVSMFASVASAGDNAEAIAKLQSVKESYAASLRLEALQAKQVSPEKVNMVTNRVSGDRLSSVAIDGKTYFGAGDAYASTLRMNAAVRTAVDPSTSKKIDKASAVTFADASGRVFYFESESSYREFIGLATPETVYGYSAPR